MFFAPVFLTSDVRKCSIVMIWKVRSNNEKVRISDHASGVLLNKQVMQGHTIL